MKVTIKLRSAELENKNISDSITLDFITNLAMRTDDDLELGREVRRILGVAPSRRYAGDTYRHAEQYLPADNKL